MKLGCAVLVSAFGLGACVNGETEVTFEQALCTTNYTLTGSYTKGQSPPTTTDPDTGETVAAIQGCWPDGLWTFTMTPSDGDCAAPSVPSVVTFRTTWVRDVADPTAPAYTFQLQAPTTGTANSRVKMSSGGGGLCEGIVELFSDDGKEDSVFHPVLSVFDMDGPLTGQGTFSRYATDQVPHTDH